MANEPDNRLVPPVATVEAAPPPAPRELRAQVLHRLQVGLFGLAAMVLLITLANIIMDRARLAEGDSAVPSVMAGGQADDQPASDPLADIGVVPAAEASAPAQAATNAPQNAR